MSDIKFICPQCKEEQDSVIEDRVQRAYYTVIPEGEGNYLYQLNDYGDIHNVRFHCPNCDKIVAHDEDGLDKLFFPNKEGSPDYPIGGMVEPYDIEREKKLTE